MKTNSRMLPLALSLAALALNALPTYQAEGASFVATGSMTNARKQHTATLLSATGQMRTLWRCAM
jgi:hypothetical protein